MNKLAKSSWILIFIILIGCSNKRTNSNFTYKISNKLGLFICNENEHGCQETKTYFMQHIGLSPEEIQIIRDHIGNKNNNKPILTYDTLSIDNVKYTCPSIKIIRDERTNKKLPKILLSNIVSDLNYEYAFVKIVWFLGPLSGSEGILIFKKINKNYEIVDELQLSIF